MTISVRGARKIEAILFDMNGTLRIREPHEVTQQAAFARMTKLLEMENPSQVFWDGLADRYKSYGAWAQENLLQLSEQAIWTDWLLPEIPAQKIEPIAAELSLAWSERKGRAVPKPEAQATLLELKRRGYRLGLISNSMSSLDIPGSLAAFGWEDLFEVVLLSCMVKCRKPASEIFWQATNKLKIDPACCAYVGNRVSKDVAGCKQAGFELALIITSDGTSSARAREESMHNYAVVHSLSELLDYFPSLPRP